MSSYFPVFSKVLAIILPYAYQTGENVQITRIILTTSGQGRRGQQRENDQNPPQWSCSVNFFICWSACHTPQDVVTQVLCAP